MTEETKAQDITYDLAASSSFAQDGICFVARGSGLYRSDDGGHTWHFAYHTLSLKAPLATIAVVVSPDFALDQSVFAGVLGGILRSFDGGQNWHITMLLSPPLVVTALVISPDYAQDGTLLAGTLEDGVFRSADRGRCWAGWNFGLLDLSILCLALSPSLAQDETLFVGTETGIFRSANGGRAWREVDFPTEFAPVLSLAPSPGYVNDGILFGVTEACGFFRSEDRGLSWTRLGKDAITDANNGIILSPEFPAKPDLILLLSDALLVSRHGGKSWSDWKVGLALEQGTVSVVAPQGFEAGAPLLVGLVEGAVLRIWFSPPLPSLPNAP